ncbi:MAG: glycosyltransferase family 4 protein [Caldisphaeraceae archaeon]|nr:glycosyltransferase family 4 protein [Caldisphaeraceae archaeon]MEB3692649.1 glycosyltransferase family 4 protein [Caldisphaeraceae archaeon]MEB3797723.1 glycosyltransferase family 4 protein [Caldisphaeraceae archaeon]
MDFKFYSVMYQTSNSKGQELVAQRMLKFALKLGYKGYLITSIYHDGEPVISDRELEILGKPYRVFERDPRIGLPTIRVLSRKLRWPPRRIYFRDYISVLNMIEKEIGIDFIVTHSTLWNGPEDTAKWILWRKIMESMGVHEKRVVFGHMSHFQPPTSGRYDPFERTYRIAWNTTELPSIFKAADIILAVTGVEAEDMITMGAQPSQIFIFPGGLDDEEAKEIDNAKGEDFLDEFRIENGKKVISYLGTVEERKNPAGVVQVAKMFRNNDDVVFVIAGKPGDQWEKVIKEARKLRNVIVTGELSIKQKASLIKASYLNIIMSRIEALGLTQIEFMYGGVPVVTSATYGQKWLITHNRDGIHLNGPDDIQGAYKAIMTLLNNESLRDEMGKNARDKAKGFLLSTLMKSLLEKAKQISQS